MSIEMLMVIDYYYSLSLEEIVRGNENEPVAITGCLGWIFSRSFKQVRFHISDETKVFFSSKTNI